MKKTLHLVHNSISLEIYTQMTARRTREAFSLCLSWENWRRLCLLSFGKNRRRPFTLSELRDDSVELSIIILSQMGDDWREELEKILHSVSDGRRLKRIKEDHLVSAGRLQGRTQENPLPCFSWEMTQKNWSRPSCLSWEITRKNWRRPNFTLQEELKKTLHLVGAEKWLRRTSWRRPHNSSHLSCKKVQRNWRRPSIWEITGRKNWRRPFTLYQLGDDSEELQKTLHLVWAGRLHLWLL